MALYANHVRENHRITKARQDIDAAQTIEGCDCIWDVSTIGAGGYTVTVAPLDKSRYNQYETVNAERFQPTMIIKCSADASANNVLVVSSDGAGGTTTHYTFAANYSVTPRYIALRISATKGADGTDIWELA